MATIERVKIGNDIYDIRDAHDFLRRHYLASQVTGTAGTSSTKLSSTYNVTDETVTEYYDGLMVSFILPHAGVATYGSVFQINNLGYKPIVYNLNSIITTRYPTGSVIVMVYNAVQTATAYLTSATATTVTGCWQVMDYDANSNTVPAAYCATAAATAAKTATYTNYALLANSYLYVTTVYSNTSKTALTLNINSKGAKPIYINGAASSTSNYTLPAGSYITYYNGTNYYFDTTGKIPYVTMASDVAVAATASKVAERDANGAVDATAVNLCTAGTTTANASIQYDATSDCIKFVFN